MGFDVIVTLLGLALGVIAIAVRRDRFIGTTLIAPSRWMIIAICCLIAVILYCSLGNATPSTAEALRYLAATSTFCPLMAILGAKRPQNIGWQWIVGTLWIVLILPVGEMFFLWRGGAMDVGPARSWLLVILLFVGLTNYSLTKFVVPAIFATVGQGLLLLAHLPIVGRESERGFLIGCLLIVAAIGLAWFQTRSQPSNGGWSLVWTEFRNVFGLVWGLRVMERVNSTAKLCNWSNELTWFGFTQDGPQENDGNSPDQTKEREEVERSMRTLLRRFVSAEWIDRRHGTSESIEN